MLIARELDLEVVHARITEGGFGAREIEFPHAAEALVIDRLGAMPVGGEALAPFAQGLGIMQPQDLDVGDIEPALLDMRQYFGKGRDIAARENIFLGPVARGTRSVR